MVAQVVVYLTYLLLVAVLVGKVGPRGRLAIGIHYALGHVNGYACHRQVVGIAAEVYLHDTACPGGEGLVAQLIGASARHGRELEHDVVVSDGLHLVLGIVGPVDTVAVEVDEVGVVAHDAHVAEVAVVLVSGNIHMLVAVLGGFGSAYAVGGCLGEESHTVEADALAMEVVANRIVIGDGCAERIDAGILHVIDNGEIARTIYVSSLLVRVTTELEARSLDAVVEVGEAVEIHSFALLGLDDLQQTRLAHGGIPLHHGQGVAVGIADAVAQLVAVIHQLVGLQAHGEYVIGDPLIKQIAFRAEIRIGGEYILIGVLVTVEHPAHDLLGHIVGRRIDALLTPERIGLGKDSESVLAVFGCQGIRLAVARLVAEACTHIFKEVGDGIRLVESLIGLVSHSRQSVHQPTSQHTLGKGEIAVGALLDDVAQVGGTGHVSRRNDLVHLEEHAIDDLDVAILLVDRAVAVDIDAVGIVFGGVISEPLVVEVGQGELGVVHCGEL